MNIVLRVVFNVFQLLLMFVAWILAWVLQVIAGLFVTDKYKYHHVASRIFRYANWIVMIVLNFAWSVTVLRPIPKEAEDKKVKYIAMINHCANSDPFVLLPAFLFTDRDWKWASKGSLFNVPFGGWCLARQGDMAIKFTKEKGGWGTEKGSVRGLMEQAVDHLEHGAGVAVFPEGVRSPNPKGPLGEFKAGFFDLALEHGYKILPIAMSGSEDSWPVGGFLDSATVYITCGDLISVEGHDRESLIKKVRGKIHEMRENHPDRKGMNVPLN